MCCDGVSTLDSRLTFVACPALSELAIFAPLHKACVHVGVFLRGVVGDLHQPFPSSDACFHSAAEALGAKRLDSFF